VAPDYVSVVVTSGRDDHTAYRMEATADFQHFFTQKANSASPKSDSASIIQGDRILLSPTLLSNHRFSVTPGLWILPSPASSGEKMKTYLIGYDLNKPEQDYEDLIAAIKETFKTWWHHLDSTWIVKTDQSAKAIRDLLGQHIGRSDELLVVRLSGEGAWVNFSDDGSRWLSDNLSWD
jgi:hypothetical protein